MVYCPKNYLLNIFFSEPVNCAQSKACKFARIVYKVIRLAPDVPQMSLSRLLGQVIKTLFSTQ